MLVMPPKYKTSHFSIQDKTILVEFGTHATKTPTYPVIWSFPLFVALYDRNLPTLLIDRQTDVILLT